MTTVRIVSPGVAFSSLIQSARAATSPAKGTITVTEIYVKLRLEQSVASQHLAILRKAGFVKTKRDGKFIYYAPNLPRIRQINQLTQTIAGN